MSEWFGFAWCTVALIPLLLLPEQCQPPAQVAPIRVCPGPPPLRSTAVKRIEFGDPGNHNSVQATKVHVCLLTQPKSIHNYLHYDLKLYLHYDSTKEVTWPAPNNHSYAN